MCPKRQKVRLAECGIIICGDLVRDCVLPCLFWLLFITTVRTVIRVRAGVNATHAQGNAPSCRCALICPCGESWQARSAKSHSCGRARATCRNMRASTHARLTSRELMQKISVALRVTTQMLRQSVQKALLATHGVLPNYHGYHAARWGISVAGSVRTPRPNREPEQRNRWSVIIRNESTP